MWYQYSKQVYMGCSVHVAGWPLACWVVSNGISYNTLQTRLYTRIRSCCIMLCFFGLQCYFHWFGDNHIDRLAQDCSNSSALAIDMNSAREVKSWRTRNNWSNPEEYVQIIHMNPNIIKTQTTPKIAYKHVHLIRYTRIPQVWCVIKIIVFPTSVNTKIS